MRTPGEYAWGHIEGFVNIPLDDLREHIDQIPQDRPVYVICHSGLRSYLACRILMQNNLTCYNFSGGYSFYQAVTAERCAAENAYPCGMPR